MYDTRDGGDNDTLNLSELPVMHISVCHGPPTGPSHGYNGGFYATDTLRPSDFCGLGIADDSPSQFSIEKLRTHLSVVPEALEHAVAAVLSTENRVLLCQHLDCAPCARITSTARCSVCTTCCLGVICGAHHVAPNSPCRYCLTRGRLSACPFGHMMRRAKHYGDLLARAGLPQDSPDRDVAETLIDISLPAIIYELTRRQPGDAAAPQ